MSKTQSSVNARHSELPDATIRALAGFGDRGLAVKDGVGLEDIVVLGDVPQLAVGEFEGDFDLVSVAVIVAVVDAEDDVDPEALGVFVPDGVVDGVPVEVAVRVGVLLPVDVDV